jgi:hypothetical protein
MIHTNKNEKMRLMNGCPANIPRYLPAPVVLCSSKSVSAPLVPEPRSTLTVSPFGYEKCSGDVPLLFPSHLHPNNHAGLKFCPVVSDSTLIDSTTKKPPLARFTERIMSAIESIRRKTVQTARRAMRSSHQELRVIIDDEKHMTAQRTALLEAETRGEITL